MTPMSPALNRPRTRTRTGLATLGVALLVALTGCGGDAAGQSGDTLRDQDLVFENALTVCSDMPYEPFEYLENGQPTGFDIDLVDAIAEKLVDGLYPSPLANRALADASRAWLDSHPDVPALRRLVIERLAGIDRALAAQARDAQDA